MTKRRNRFTIGSGDLQLVKQGEGPTLAESAGMSGEDVLAFAYNDENSDEKNEKIKQILADVRRLAVEYYQLTKKPLGCTGEIAEYIAAEKLGLKLVAARAAGYDAIRETSEREEKIQIKGRAHDRRRKPGQRISRIRIDSECDKVLLVLLHNDDMQPYEIWEADFEDVKKHLQREPISKSHARGALGLAEFTRLPTACKVWSNQVVS
jgi:hypothetical protein